MRPKHSGPLCSLSAPSNGDVRDEHPTVLCGIERSATSFFWGRRRCSTDSLSVLMKNWVFLPWRYLGSVDSQSCAGTFFLLIYLWEVS